MDLSYLIPEIPALIEELEELLADYRILLCLEHRQWLAACMSITPVHKSLVGAVTTEDEAFELVRKGISGQHRLGIGIKRMNVHIGHLWSDQGRIRLISSTIVSFLPFPGP